LNLDFKMSSYRAFVKQHIGSAPGKTQPEKMKAVAAAWRRQKGGKGAEGRGFLSMINARGHGIGRIPRDVRHSKTHPGFHKIAERIARKEHLPIARANAILAASTRRHLQGSGFMSDFLGGFGKGFHGVLDVGKSILGHIPGVKEAVPILDTIQDVVGGRGIRRRRGKGVFSRASPRGLTTSAWA
jgi:hypothetical protein